MKIITIDREFGAGGHTVGREVAKRLGIEFYDRDIIRGAALEGDIAIEQVEEQEESISKIDQFIRAINPVSYDSKDTIFTYESKAILHLAEKGACVFLGRCSKDILEEAGYDVLSVFLHADEDHRLAAAGKILESTDENHIRYAMRKKDIARAAYVACYTNGKWGDAHEYSITLDTGKLGFEACTQIVVDLAKNL